MVFSRFANLFQNPINLIFDKLSNNFQKNTALRRKNNESEIGEQYNISPFYHIKMEIFLSIRIEKHLKWLYKSEYSDFKYSLCDKIWIG